LAYPRAMALIETRGWQIVTDASKEAMQAWLDERRKAKHSVTWMDAAQVGDQPVFSAVATTDDRAADWVAVLDTPVVPVAAAAKPFDRTTHHFVTVSGYVNDGELRATCLFHPVSSSWFAVPDVDRVTMDEVTATAKKRGHRYRSFRPYLDAQGVTLYAVVTDRAPDETGDLKFGMTLARFEQFAADERRAGRRLLSLTPYLVEAD